MPIKVYPKSNFALTKRQQAPVLSCQEEARLLRQPECVQLETQLSPFLATMPQITIRSSTEKKIFGQYAFLVSTTPIRGILLPDEVIPPRFFGKLAATAYNAGLHAFNSLRDHPLDQEMVVSFNLILGRIVEPGHNNIGDGRATYNCVETTFPVYRPGNHLLGEMRYERNRLFSPLAEDHPNDIQIRLEFKRLAIFYRDTLRFLLKLARNKMKFPLNSFDN